jgi:excisionase family DNA binding protein
MALITTAQAAEKLGISVRRVQELISSGRLPAQQFGRTYVVDEDDLKLVAERKPGRPRKSPNTEAAKPEEKTAKSRTTSRS